MGLHQNLSISYEITMKIFQHDLQVTETNSATGSDEIDVQVPTNYKGAKKDKDINNWRLTLHFFYK